MHWSSADWQRPSSPQRASRWARPGRGQQHAQDTYSYHSSSQAEQLHPPPCSPRQNARDKIERTIAVGQLALSQGHTAGLQGHTGAGDGPVPVKMAGHYVGLARGELGVLTKRQVGPALQFASPQHTAGPVSFGALLPY